MLFLELLFWEKWCHVQYFSQTHRMVAKQIKYQAQWTEICFHDV